MSHRKRPRSGMAWSLFLVAGTCLLLAGCNTFLGRGASSRGSRSAGYDMPLYQSRPREEKQRWFASWFVKEEPPRPTTTNEWFAGTERIDWDGGTKTMRLP